MLSCAWFYSEYFESDTREYVRTYHQHLLKRIVWRQRNIPQHFLGASESFPLISPGNKLEVKIRINECENKGLSEE